jgi:NADPH-dependent 2,4-dienoyl-CoA reductase/sulfur reductase-like enzyme
MRRIAIVGASLAGTFTARAFRTQGYDGELVVVGEERHRPYDRPPLSKELLSGETAVTELVLEAEGEDLGLTWRLGTRAVGLSAGPTLHLDGGESLPCDGVVVATGAVARTGVPGWDLPGAHVLRTVDDALALRNELRNDLHRGGRLVVVGGGFIGSEVAATARSMGLEVTLVVAEGAPLRGALGEFADVVADLHDRHGIEVVTGSRVRRVRETEDMLAVVLDDGREVRGSTVVLGLGAVPAVGWLAGSEIDLHDGVLCDVVGATSMPGVVAVGDCASWFDPDLGRHHRVEHWTAARERAAVAARTLLSGGTAEHQPRRAPYMWSDIHGRRIQLAGHPELADTVAVEAGSPDECSFAAVYRRDGAPVAVLAIDQPRPFNAVRRQLVTQPSTKSSTAPLSVPGAVS